MFRLLLLATALLLISSCKQKPSGSERSSIAATTQVFQVKGVIKDLKPDGKTVDIRHEEITNYMPAMTMPFEVKNSNELTGLKAGDVVTFRLTVTEKDEWIDQVRKEASANPVELPSKATFRLVRDVEPLQIGDRLPEYHFTNELGQPVSTSQFKGQALSITFIFTRCPLPNFCPLMSNNFSDVQKKLLAKPGGPANWHLLTITFDPEFDNPAVLNAYSKRFGADPAHWNVLTGDLIDITAISEQFGQTFWREEGALNHNLRTAVVDALGRVQKIFTGNKWTADELAEELITAAATK